MKNRQAGRGGDIARALAVADHQQRVGARELRIERRPQGSGRKHARIAEAAPSVDDRQGEILGERCILQAVVHDDDAGAGRARGLRASDAVARDDGRRHARQQQRLVADLRGAIGYGRPRVSARRRLPP